MKIDYPTLFLLGRIFYGGYFLLSGLRHFSSRDPYSAYAGSKGVPLPKIAVIGSGLLIFLGGAGILMGRYITWSVLLIALFLVPVTVMMHNFWRVADPAQRAAERINFEKNLALLGAALMLLLLPTPWPYEF